MVDGTGERLLTHNASDVFGSKACNPLTPGIDRVSIQSELEKREHWPFLGIGIAMNFNGIGKR